MFAVEGQGGDRMWKCMTHTYARAHTHTHTHTHTHVEMHAYTVM